MDKQKVMELNKEFVKLVTETPELPIKVLSTGNAETEIVGSSEKFTIVKSPKQRNIRISVTKETTSIG